MGEQISAGKVNFNVQPANAAGVGESGSEVGGGESMVRRRRLRRAQDCVAEASDRQCRKFKHSGTRGRVQRERVSFGISFGIS
jgi:hypothetical protein